MVRSAPPGRAAGVRPQETSGRTAAKMRTAGAFRPGRSQDERVLDEGDVGRPRPLGAVDDFELHPITFVESPEALHPDLRVMDEHVRPTLTGEKTETLGLVEPLDSAFDHYSTGPPGPWA